MGGHNTGALRSPLVAAQAPTNGSMVIVSRVVELRSINRK
jgi:hypothetical protein